MAETAKTADRALAVLRALADRGPMTPSQLAELLSLNRTVTHRLLITLQQRGFVMRRRGGYLPGPSIIRAAAGVQPEVGAAARATMAQLTTEVGETTVLHVADGDSAVVLEQVVASQHVVRVEHAVGSRGALSKGASGRTLLAFMPADAAERSIVTADDPDWLRQELIATQKMGHTISSDEIQQGTSGLAVPVRDRAGTVVAALAVLAPTMRAGRLTDYLAPLERASAHITAELPT